MSDVVSGGPRGVFVRNAVLAGRPCCVLDIGSGTGGTLGGLLGHVDRLVGVEPDPAHVAGAQAAHPTVEFVNQGGETLPFSDESFSAVIVSDVLEHVPAHLRQPIIGEAHRVLAPGGRLVLTSPHAGWTAWLDPMDFKRRRPRVYRAYSRLTGYQPTDSYELGHQHLTDNDLTGLLRTFTIVEAEYTGFVEPIISWVLTVGERLRVFPRAVVDRLNQLRGWESGVRYPAPMAFNARFVAVKHGTERGQA